MFHLQISKHFTEYGITIFTLEIEKKKNQNGKSSTKHVKSGVEICFQASLHYIPACCLVLTLLTQCIPSQKYKPRCFLWLNCPLLDQQQVITSSEVFTTGVCCKAVPPVSTSPSTTENVLKFSVACYCGISFIKNFRHRKGWKRDLAIWQRDSW